MARQGPPHLGALVMAGIPGKKLTERTAERLASLRPAGVVLFSRNIGSPQQLRTLNEQLRDLLGPRAILAVDQEGGRVARLARPFTQWPAMRALGTIPGLRHARDTGSAIGRELAAAGFNCDFAPVLDVDSNPANPIIGDRAFSNTPSRVARLALAFADGLEDAGIVPCGKHFPGHGDTHADSHLEQPTVGHSAARLHRVEFAPFRAASKTGIPFLMSAHVLYPALDPELPATLSSRILIDLLRKEMEFSGVVASDDLAMHALDHIGSLGERAVRAVQAGCDLVLACQRLGDAEKALAALDKARTSGRLDAGRLRASLAHLRVLRSRIAAGGARRRSVGIEEALRGSAAVRRRLQLLLDRRRVASGSPRTSRAKLRR